VRKERVQIRMPFKKGGAWDTEAGREDYVRSVIKLRVWVAVFGFN
jgi:hypothetical protein